MNLLKLISITLGCLLSCFAYAQDTYVEFTIQNPASYSFAVRTPSPLQLDPRGAAWITVKVGEEVMFIKGFKKYPLFVVTPEMHHTVIDVSSTAKLRNKGNMEEIVYIEPPRGEKPPPSEDGTYASSSPEKSNLAEYARDITTHGTSWSVSHHPELDLMTADHKTIAVVPVNVTITDKKLKKNKNSKPEVIAEKEKEFQRDFQRSFYERLVQMKDEGALKTEIQDIAATNKLLAQNGIENISDLLEQEQFKIADMLGVDAVFSADVEIVQLVSKGGALLLEAMGNTAVSTERSRIDMGLYDGYTGARIWRVWRQFDNNSVFWETEKLIENMFNDELSEKFPYHAYLKDGYVEILLENPSSYIFTMRTPSPLALEPRTAGTVTMRVGEVINFMKWGKEHPLLLVTPEMHLTAIDVSKTAKLRNNGNMEDIVYLKAPEVEESIPQAQAVSPPPPPKEQAVPSPPPPVLENPEDRFSDYYNDDDNDGYYNKKEDYYTIVQQMPRFPGCEDMSGSDDEKKRCSEKKMLEFIYTKIKYPKTARENKIQGMVVITYIIEKDGRMTNAKILRDLGGGCGKEALRVVKSMPTWIPGKQRNQPVRVQFNLPIRFKTNG